MMALIDGELPPAHPLHAARDPQWPGVVRLRHIFRHALRTSVVVQFDPGPGCFQDAQWTDAMRGETVPEGQKAYVVGRIDGENLRRPSLHISRGADAEAEPGGPLHASQNAQEEDALEGVQTSALR